MDLVPSTASHGTRRGRWLALLVTVAILSTACGASEPTLGPIEAGPQPTDADTAGGSQLAWGQLDVVEGTLPGDAAATVLDEADAIGAAWQRYGFAGDVPSIDPETEVLLLLGRADNACPDELIGLEVADGRLVTDWLEPPGDCNDPLIRWLYAVQVYRGVLGDGFTYALDEPFAGELAAVTIELPPFDDDGSRTAPTPPQAMADDEVAAVFADHPIRRCGPDDDPIAAAFGPLDEPVDEFDADQEAALDHVEAAMALLHDAGFEPHADVTGLIDRSTGTTRAAVVVHAPDADEVQDLLDDELGPGTVTVWADPWDAREVQAAQEALGGLMGPGSDGPGTIVSTSGAPGPVVVAMVDPTREALDAIADRVDAELVCVDVIRSGVRPRPAG
jgi:hypothetical protein